MCSEELILPKERSEFCLQLLEGDCHVLAMPPGMSYLIGMYLQASGHWPPDSITT